MATRPDLASRVIIRAVSDFLTLGDMTKVALVSKGFAHALHFAKFVHPRALSVLFDSCEDDKDLAKAIAKNLSFDTFCALADATENLIENSEANRGFSGWETKTPNLWAVGAWGSIRDRRKAFVSSFCKAKLSQEVPIRLPIDTGQEWYVLAGTIFRQRAMVPGLVSLHVSMQIGNIWIGLKSIVNVKTTSKREMEAYCKPGLVYVFERVPEKATRLKIEIEGEETMRWSGHYGPSFGYTYLRLVPVSVSRNYFE